MSAPTNCEKAESSFTLFITLKLLEMKHLFLAPSHLLLLVHDGTFLLGLATSS